MLSLCSISSWLPGRLRSSRTRKLLCLRSLESEVRMQEYWTQPATYDPLEFDTRFRPELLDVWLPHFIRLADLAAAQRVLDLGSGPSRRCIASCVLGDASWCVLWHPR